MLPCNVVLRVKPTGSQIGSQNSCDHLQTAAGNVAAICGCLQAKIIIILSKFLIKLIRKAHFIINKRFCLHQTDIS